MLLQTHSHSTSVWLVRPLGGFTVQVRSAHLLPSPSLDPVTDVEPAARGKTVCEWQTTKHLAINLTRSVRVSLEENDNAVKDVAGALRLQRRTPLGSGSPHAERGPLAHVTLQTQAAPMGFLQEMRQVNSEVHVGEDARIAKKTPRGEQKDHATLGTTASGSLDSAMRSSRRTPTSSRTRSFLLLCGGRTTYLLQSMTRNYAIRNLFSRLRPHLLSLQGALLLVPEVTPFLEPFPTHRVPRTKFSGGADVPPAWRLVPWQDGSWGHELQSVPEPGGCLLICWKAAGNTGHDAARSVGSLHVWVTAASTKPGKLPRPRGSTGLTVAGASAGPPRTSTGAFG